jgi:hypothetical protein
MSDTVVAILALWKRTLFLAAVAIAALAGGAHSNEPSGSADKAPARMSAGSQTFNAAGGADNAKTSERLREGTKLVDVIGTFQSAGGDSIAFSREDGKDSFRVLENLALQRVGQVLEEDRGTRKWIVSGVITEYRGANYLLVTKAVVQLQEGEAAAQVCAVALLVRPEIQSKR